MNYLGLHLSIGCPNATSVGKVMDDLFQTFKGYCRTSTQDLFNENIYNIMIKICERNSQENRLDKEKIPSVVAQHQEDISVIVKGYPNDPIDKRPFDMCFTYLKIKKFWINIGLSPFNTNAFKNKKIQHEIGEPESNIHVGETSQYIKKLSEDSWATKIKFKDEDYNHEIFDIKIPHAYKAQRKATKIEQVQELVNKGATFSASGIFMHTRSMFITSEAILSASRIVLDNRNAKAKNKQDGAAQKLQDFKLKAEQSYDVFKSGAFVTVVMYTSMLRYALIATKSGDTMSSFKNK